MPRVTYREEPCKSALNRVRGMPFDWSLNPYTGCSHRCAFCYVRAFEKRADRPSDARYGTDVRVKVNFVEVLRGELARKSWKREAVTLGAATDPYQPCESRYRLTRRTIETLAEFRTPIHIITRGPMILRDLDVLTSAARRVEVSINVSIPTLDAKVLKVMEPGVAPGTRRIAVVKALVEAGLDAGIGMAPILPGITDTRESMAAVVHAARAAGATRVWAIGLFLRPGTREHFLSVLESEWPELLPMYARLYAGRAYLARAAVEPIQAMAKELKRQFGIADRRSIRLEPEPVDEEPQQLGLGL